MFPVLNLSVKFDANIFINDRYMAILLLRWFGGEMPISAHVAAVFFLGGGRWPLNVIRYCGDPQKAHPWRKHAFWRIGRADPSKNATWARAEESKKRKKRKEIQRCDKSHTSPYHPRCATLTKVVMCRGVTEIVNHTKFHQNRLRGFGSLRGQILPFCCAWRYGLYNCSADAVQQLWIIDH